MRQIYQTKAGNLACYVGLTAVEVGCFLGFLYGLGSPNEQQTAYEFLFDLGLIVGCLGVGARASLSKKDLKRIKNETIDTKVLE